MLDFTIQRIVKLLRNLS